MTTLQLRAELFREMNPLLDSEAALEKMLAFVRSLLVVNNSANEPQTEFRPYTMEEINERLERSERDFAEGRYYTDDEVFGDLDNDSDLEYGQHLLEEAV